MVTDLGHDDAIVRPRRAADAGAPSIRRPCLL